MKETRPYMVGFKVTRSERAALRKATKAAKIPLSQYIRGLLLAENAPEVTTEPSEAIEAAS